MEKKRKVASVHVHKKGIRALGIAESFVKGVSATSVLAGVVMRADMVVDGFTFAEATVGGMDATQKVIQMYKALERDDVNVLLLNGCVISWYNVIDLNWVAQELGLPLVCVTYDDSEGLEKYFKENFPDDWQTRVEVYRQNGPRKPVELNTGRIVYVRGINVSEDETLRLLKKFTLHGAAPEPLRIARLLARNLMRSRLCSASRVAHVSS
jgi:endonuclease V-like protein UPF0215 family